MNAEQPDTEAACPNGEQAWSFVFAQVSDPLILLDADGAVCEWNPAAEAFFGRSSEHARGEHISRFLPEFPVDKARAEALEMKLSLARSDGENSPVEAASSPLPPGASGASIVCILRPATGRRESDLRRSLAAANAKLGRRNAELLAVETIGKSVISTLDRDAILRALAEALVTTYSMDYVLVALLESDGRLVVRCCAEKDETGTSWTWPDDHIGREADERLIAYPDVSGETMRSLLAEAYPATSGTWNFDVLPIEKDVAQFGVLVLGWRSGSHEDLTSQLSAVRTILDQTAIALDHASIVERLRAADSIKSDLFAAMSHELRTPLAAILGFSETLLTALDPPLASEAREFVEIIRRQGRMLLTQIENLLDLSDLEAGLVSLHRTWLELGEILLDATSAMPEITGKKEVEFALNASDETLAAAVWADQPRVATAVKHLLENAVKFTERGKITLSAEVRNKDVRIAVSDTGPGIPQEEREHLFHRSYQSDRGTMRRVRGSGLGLSIVRHIVELHGGRVGVQSEPGRGSTFWIRLPRAGPDLRRGDSR